MKLNDFTMHRDYAVSVLFDRTMILRTVFAQSSRKGKMIRREKTLNIIAFCQVLYKIKQFKLEKLTK